MTGGFSNHLEQCIVCGSKDVANIDVCGTCEGVFCLGCVIGGMCGIGLNKSKAESDENAGEYVEVSGSGGNSAEIGGNLAEIGGNSAEIDDLTYKFRKKYIIYNSGSPY